MARDYPGTTNNFLYTPGTAFSLATYSCGGWVYLDTNSYGSEPNGDPAMFAHAYAGTPLPVALFIGNGGTGTNTRWTAGRYDAGWAVISDVAAAPTGQWTHILMTMGAGTCRLYRDGTERNNGAITVVNGTTQNLNVGARWDQPGTGNSIDGRMAELGFWAAVLTADEVASLWSGAPPPLVRRASLIGHWPLHGLAYPEVDLAGAQRNLSQQGAVAAANDKHPPVSRATAGAGY